MIQIYPSLQKRQHTLSSLHPEFIDDIIPLGVENRQSLYANNQVPGLRHGFVIPLNVVLDLVRYKYESLFRFLTIGMMYI